ncbi:EscU/YscU/HrcU family type III secretion system export apparatus switch protein, partial [Escherichia coli]
MAIDVPFQTWNHTRQLKMTKQEVKDEFKDSEGKPEVKGRIRQLQMQMAMRRMMGDVPKADVIITNPPFSLTEEFMRKSLSELAPDGTLIYLQRVNFLGSKRRVPFWAEIGFPNKTPILVPRPRFVGGGSDSCEYCWFI